MTDFELRTYLDEYVRSSRDGGAGSEYFRLAVDAHGERATLKR